MVTLLFAGDDDALVLSEEVDPDRRVLSECLDGVGEVACVESHSEHRLIFRREIIKPLGEEEAAVALDRLGKDAVADHDVAKLDRYRNVAALVLNPKIIGKREAVVLIILKTYARDCAVVKLLAIQSHEDQLFPGRVKLAVNQAQRIALTGRGRESLRAIVGGKKFEAAH